MESERGRILEVLNSGQFDLALDAAEQWARRQMKGAEARLLLFELLAVAGEWDRAGEQLEVIARRDASWVLAAGTFRHLLAGEKLRALVLSGVSPVRFLEDAHPAPVAAPGAGRRAVPSSINGCRYGDWTDVDARYSDLLEIILPEGYFHVPVASLRHVECGEPSGLTDLIWIGADIELHSGRKLRGYLPARYPGSERSADAEIRMGWRTSWNSEDGRGVTGMGQRIFQTRDPESEIAILELRSLEQSQ